MRWFSEFLLPTICIGCSNEGATWCSSCAKNFAHHPFDVDVGYDLSVRSLSTYQGPIARLINMAKEKCSTAATKILADSLTVVVGSYASQSMNMGLEVALVPIPTGRAAIRRRGADPIKEMTRLVGSRVQPSLPIVTKLGNKRERREQSGLSVTERAQNTFGSFVWAAHEPRRLAVILVDDVVTTGATLMAAAEALRSGGQEVIGCATIAATRRWAHSKQAP